LLLVQGFSALGDVNVYDKPMTDCGPDHAGGCTYAAADAGAHQVCVTQLPQGFSSVTGQGPWSDQYTGQPWCICIWAYSNYILQNKDLPLKCESIPSAVLEEQYSLDKFKQCGSMSSTAGCGAEDIRRSIQSLCQQCDQQATDQASKNALKAKCDAIVASAPAADMPQLYSAEVPQTKDIAPFAKTVALTPTAMAFLVSGFVIAGIALNMVIRTFSAREPREDTETVFTDLEEIE
jgi:hypothetical protein